MKCLTKPIHQFMRVFRCLNMNVTRNAFKESVVHVLKYCFRDITQHQSKKGVLDIDFLIYSGNDIIFKVNNFRTHKYKYLENLISAYSSFIQLIDYDNECKCLNRKTKILNTFFCLNELQETWTNPLCMSWQGHFSRKIRWNKKSQEVTMLSTYIPLFAIWAILL